MKTPLTYEAAVIDLLESFGVDTTTIRMDPAKAVHMVYSIGEDLAFDPCISAKAAKVSKELEEARATVAQLRGLVETLWGLLDNVDTLTDACKSDDKAFRELATKQVLKRWDTGITTDGYTLTIPKPPEAPDNAPRTRISAFDQPIPR